jgi:tRNA uridine 5-carboxymethylaminomethyl modification enzyme
MESVLVTLLALCAEAREELAWVRPISLGWAARIPRVTPAAVSLLLIHLNRRGSN